MHSFRWNSTRSSHPHFIESYLKREKRLENIIIIILQETIYPSSQILLYSLTTSKRNRKAPVKTKKSMIKDHFSHLGAQLILRKSDQFGHSHPFPSIQSNESTIEMSDIHKKRKGEGRKRGGSGNRERTESHIFQHLLNYGFRKESRQRSCSLSLLISSFFFSNINFEQN